MYTVVYTQKVAHTDQIITSLMIHNSDTPTPFHMQGLNALAKSLVGSSKMQVSHK